MSTKHEVCSDPISADPLLSITQQRRASRRPGRASWASPTQSIIIVSMIIGICIMFMTMILNLIIISSSSSSSSSNMIISIIIISSSSIVIMVIIMISCH